MSPINSSRTLVSLRRRRLYAPGGKPRSRQSLDRNENGGHEESADERLRHHTPNDRGPDHLTRDRAGSGGDPQRHATENESKRGHHEGAKAEPRPFQRGIDQGFAFFVLLFGKSDNQN